VAVAPVLEQQTEPLTFADLQGLPDDGNRYELLDGLLLVTPPPNTAHQRCVKNLVILVAAAIPDELDVFTAPFDWLLDERNVFEPDVVVFRREDVGSQRLERTPVLVVEVLSLSTRRRDLTLKRAAYARAGVTAYWVVDPDVPALRVFEAGEEVARVDSSDPYTAERPFPVTVVPADLLA
jgi:Uma2 family endonuclease